MGFVACEDLGVAAAEILCNPEQHSNKVYYLSVESICFKDVAVLLGKELGIQKPLRCVNLTPEQLDNPAMPYATKLETAYKECIKRFIPLFDQGVLTDLDDVTEDTAKLLKTSGRKPMTVQQFIQKHRDEIVARSQ